MNPKIPDIKGYCFNLSCQELQYQNDSEVCSRCGSCLFLSDRYRAVRLLGQGGMSRTFLVTDRSIPSPTLFILKQLWGEAARCYPLEPFQSLMEQKQWIYHLPRYLDHFEREGVSYRVQEYISGQNLAEILAIKEIFEPRDIWQLLEQLLPSLHQLHEWGIIHGDIKPENIICRLLPDSSPQKDSLAHWVLVDGGIATGLSPVQPMLIGGSAYAAPEQLNGKPLFASDLYSLGVTCIHLLSGMHPFCFIDDSDRRWREQNYGLSALLDSFDPALVQFLDRLIAPDSSGRITSAAVAITEMQKIRGKPRVSPQTRSPAWICDATLLGHSGLFANINALAIDPHSQILASASDDKTIRLWDIEKGQEQGVLQGHSHFVKSVAFHPQDPSRLVSGGRDRKIHLWDLPTQKIVQTLTGHNNTVNTVLFSPDGNILASADKTINLWDAHSGNPITTLKGHLLAVTALAFVPQACNGEELSLLASASADSTVKLWDLTSGELIQSLTGHTAAVFAIAFSPDGTWLATGGEDRTIRLWDVATQQCFRILNGHSWRVSALAATIDGKTLISGSWDKTLKIWQIDSGENIATLTGHTDSVSCVAITSDHHRILSGSYDKTVKRWQSNPDY